MEGVRNASLEGRAAVSAALDLFRSFGHSMFIADIEKEAAWVALNRAAAEWREAGRFLSAAYAMDRASYVGWGVENRVEDASLAAIEDCRRCINDSSLDSLEALAAINLWQQLLRYYDSTAVRPLRRWLQQELTDRLLYVFNERPDAVGFLVRGFALVGSFEGEWRAVVPDHVTVSGTSMTSGDHISISMPSAFALLRRAGDRETLWSLVERFPTEFESVGLRGWKLVIEAERNSARRAELYTAAADAFAADLPPSSTGGSGPQFWSGENIHVWAKHFRARAALARIPATQGQARTLIADALAALQGTWSGMVNEENHRLHIGVKALGALVGLEDPSAIDKAIEELAIARWVFGEGDWHRDMHRFLADTMATLREFADAPAAAIASSRISPFHALRFLAPTSPQFGIRLAPYDRQSLLLRQRFRCACRVALWPSIRRRRRIDSEPK